jgi:hypothetical protein
MSRKQKKSSSPPKKSISLTSVQTLANRYARLRDCFGEEGTGCISCGLWFPFEKLHGGHFIPVSRKNSALRFNEDNIHGQCARCNTFLHANLANYYINLVSKIGRERVDYLMEHQYDIHPWSQEELQQLKDYYNGRLRDIAAGKDPRKSNQVLGMQDLFKGVDEADPRQ